VTSADSLDVRWAPPSDRESIEAWDAFLLASPRGHYCQLSTWLGSFAPYGFEYEVMLVREPGTGTTIGGCGLLWFGMRPFRIAAVPIGPIVDVGFEPRAVEILSLLQAHCRRRGAALLQIRFPCAAEETALPLPALLPAAALKDAGPSRPGSAVRVAIAPGQLLWIPFADTPDAEAWRQATLAHFSSKTRRDVRVSERSGLELLDLRREDELERAFQLVEENGRRHGYATRTWNDFGRTLLEQVRRGQGSMLVATYEGQFVGCHYGVMAGRRYNHIMGGTSRINPHLNVGRFLQWAAMNRAHALGARAYDFTTKGSPTVYQFKMGFRPTVVPLVPPVTFTFGRLRAGLIHGLSGVAHRNRSRMARVLSRIRRTARPR
jgi:hypothetical protein